ncbi:MAG: cell division protein FtsQ/DivIB [Acidimicrobiales bacterium]
MATATPAHPKVLARRRAVRRTAVRRQIVLLGVGAAVASLAAIGWPVAHSSLFSAKVLVVTGNEHTPTRAVLKAAALSSHPALLDVNPGADEARIEALPWINTAKVAISWPDSVKVTVTERIAVAYSRARSAPGRIDELDRVGRVLAVADSPPPGLPQVLVAGSETPAPRAALDVAAVLPVALRPVVSALSSSPASGVDIALLDGTGVVFGPPTNMTEKFEDIAAVISGATLPAGSVLDVTVPAAPVVTPPPSTKRGASH